jgi:hypothetical protein
VERVERLEDFRGPQDAAHAQDRQHHEPDQHDRPEYRADRRRAAVLDAEQCQQDADRDRDHVRLEPRRGEIEALDRAEHRDRRRDRAVAVQQRAAEQSHADQRIAQRAGLGLAWVEQRDKRDDPAFAAIVGPHHDQQILDRDDDDQRPEDQ